MAIIRCPYCHAIIDENDKYCNNCGTQLLFPEDDSVEEEIPGEKILDVENDEEEKDYSLDEPGEGTNADVEEDKATEEERTGELVSPGAAEAGSRDIPDLLEAEVPGVEGGEEAEDAEDEGSGAGDGKTEEVIIVEEIAAQEAAAKGDDAAASESEEDTKAYTVSPVDSKAPVEETVELVIPPPAEEKATAPGAADDGGKEPKPDTENVRTGEIEEGAAADAGPAPVTFDTHELEDIGKTVELSKDRLDKMIEVMAGKQKEASGEEASEAEPEAGKKTGTLPPWADRIKGAAPVVPREDTGDTRGRFEKETWSGVDSGAPMKESGLEAAGEKQEEAKEEEIFPHRKPSDSGIGLPERVTQAALPFEAGEPATAAEGEGEEAEEEESFGPSAKPVLAELPKREEIRPVAREDARPGPGFEKEPEASEEALRPPFNFSLFLKAKAFDILFIGVFWLVALWVAARSMGATLFEVLSVVSGSALLLYAAFILMYFFLFKFFLGETLGDRLFRERE
ncbi:MAG: zinc-ribbon domain-containing protein [Candidatus Aminicenantales bacterium]